jgi:hypothetical protein
MSCEVQDKVSHLYEISKAYTRAWPFKKSDRLAAMLCLCLRLRLRPRKGRVLEMIWWPTLIKILMKVETMRGRLSRLIKTLMKQVSLNHSMKLRQVAAGKLFGENHPKEVNQKIDEALSPEPFHETQARIANMPIGRNWINSNSANLQNNNMPPESIYEEQPQAQPTSFGVSQYDAAGSPLGANQHRPICSRRL